MGQDMFKSQPVADARYSFFGTIFHGRPDSDVVATLRNTVRVIGMDSRILVYETVLPEEGVVLFHACFDLWMMAEVSGKERTRSEWDKLLAQVGLRMIAVDGKELDHGIEIGIAK